MDFTTPPTCLSPYVQQLVCQHTYSKDRDSHVLDQSGLIDFNYIGSKIPETDNCKDLSEYFTECVQILAPMLHSVEDDLSNISWQEFIQRYTEFIQWTGDAKKTLLEVWEPLFFPEVDGAAIPSVDQLTALLVTTAVLERGLGDVYLLKGSSPCPSMLKDLLVTQQLYDTLGKHIISVLRIFIGPPTSLNLRNIAWHGFPSPGEIPARCIWFVILLVPSIGKVLHDQHLSQIPHREPIEFPHTRAFSAKMPVLEHTGWLDMVSRTTLVSWTTEGFWKCVSKHYNSKRYGVCCGLLVYHLEQSLRRVFVKVNNCEYRILTAQATELFTTFDEMLDEYLPDGSKNRLRDVVGDKFLEILLDHLSYPNGPRVRDRLSHGEASWDRFPWQLTENMAAMAIYLSGLFVDKGYQCLTFQELSNTVQSYDVQFHRVSLLKAKILGLLDSVCKVDDEIKVLPDLTERGDNVLFPLTAECVAVEKNIQDLINITDKNWPQRSSNTVTSFSTLDHLRKYLEALLQTPIHILYRETQADCNSEPEKEVLSLLHHVIDECTTVKCNVQDFALLRQQQMLDKQLRSRQRENLKKFLLNYHGYLMCMCLCCYLGCWQLYHLDNLKYMSEVLSKKAIKFWKNILQICENLRTCSQPDKNKWTEGLDLIKQLVQYLQTNFNSVITQYGDNVT